jgi:endonuclease V-like protein UPF0215 family
LSQKTIRVVKPEIRVLGIDDGKFVPHSKQQVLLVGVVFRGGNWLDGVMHTTVTVDEFDAATKIADMITNSPHYKQIRVVMLNGITFAGFNIVDIKELNAKTNLPVIAVTQKKPNLTQVHQALRNLPNNEERWNAILRAGEVIPVTTRNSKQKVYIEIAGIDRETAQLILRLTSTRSNIPEALRVAHLIASGISHL